MRQGNDLYTVLARTFKKILSNKTDGGSTSQGISVSTQGADPVSTSQLEQLTGIINNQQATIDGILKYVKSQKSQIVSGGDVQANNPPDAGVLVKATSALGDGRVYESTVDQYINVLDSSIVSKPGTVFVLLNSLGTVEISTSQDSTKPTLAKIVIPLSSSGRIVDDNNGVDAYIVLKKDLFFEEDCIIDDESLAELRTIMDKLLADNLIGTIKLSNGLSITNTDGSLLLDSQSMKLKYTNQQVGMKLDKEGVRFYDENGTLLAYFKNTEAKVGAIKITSTGLESVNYATGVSGFKIKSNGDAEFNDVTTRGTIYATLGEIGGWKISEYNLQSKNGNVNLDSKTGYLQLMDGSCYLTKITPQGIFMTNKWFRVTNYPTASDDYIEDVVLKKNNSDTISDTEYYYGKKSGEFVVRSAYSGQSYFAVGQNLKATYKLHSTGTTYTDELHAIALADHAVGLFDEDGLVDVQYIKNLHIGTADIADAAITNAKIDTLNGNKIIANTITASKMNVTQLSAIAIDGGCIIAGILQNAATNPTTKFDLANGKLNIGSTDDDNTNKLVIGDATSNQYMKYNSVTGKLTVRNEDSVRYLTDFVSLQAAINDLPSYGGTVMVGACTFIVSSPIQITKSHVNIVGEGLASILTPSAQGFCYLMEIRAHGCTVQNIAIHGFGVESRGIKISGYNNSILSTDFSLFQNMIEINGGFENKIDGCAFHGNYAVAQGFGYTVHIHDGACNCSIVNNKFNWDWNHITTFGFGSDENPVTDSTCTSCAVSDNTFYGLSAMVHSAGYTGYNGKSINIKGNDHLYENNAMDSIGPISQNGSGNSIAIYAWGTKSKINNNVIKNYRTGLDLVGADSLVYGNKITGDGVDVFIVQAKSTVIGNTLFSDSPMSNSSTTSIVSANQGITDILPSTSSYQTPAERTFSIVPGNFVPTDYNNKYNMYGAEIYIQNKYLDSGNCILVAPINIPDGAIITKFKVWYTCNSNSLHLYCNLRKIAGDGTYADIITTMDCSGTSGAQTVEKVSPGDFTADTVNNDTYGYQLTINLTACTEFTYVRFHKARITYTVTRPNP